MSKEIADLIRERDAFQLEGNDYMVGKIQSIIDSKLNKNNLHNLNEVIEENKEKNTITIND